MSTIYGNGFVADNMPSGETMAQREEVCAAWHALPDELRKDQRMTRLYYALGGPRMDDPAEADTSGALGATAPDSRGPEIPRSENSGPLLSDAENSLEAPEAGLLSNLRTDEPDTSMAGDEDASGVLVGDGTGQALPTLPDSAYPPGAKPLTGDVPVDAPAPGELEALSREVDALPGAIRPSAPWPRTSGVQPSQAQIPEVIAEQFIAQMIDRGPEPLRRLADWLSKVLDEDDWKTAERLLLGAYEATAASGVLASDGGQPK